MAASQDFNGTSQQLVYDSGSDGPQQDISYPFSMVCQFNADVVSGGSKYPVAITSDTESNHRIAVRINGSNLYIAANEDGSADNHSVGAINNATWYFCVLEVNSATDRRMYLDGVQKGTTATASRDVLVNQSHLNRYCLGDLWYSTTHWEFDGKIAYAAVYDKALSTSEQLELKYHPGSIRDSIVSEHFLLEDGSVAGDYKDTSGNGYNMNGGTVPTASLNGPPVSFPVGLTT